MLERDRVVHVDDLDPPTSESVRDRDRLARNRRLRVARNELVGGRLLEPRSVERKDRRREALDRRTIGVRYENHGSRSMLPVEAGGTKAPRVFPIVEPNPHPPYSRQKMEIHFVELRGEQHAILNQAIVRMVVAERPIGGTPKRPRFKVVTVTGFTDLVEGVGHDDTLRNRLALRRHSRWRRAAFYAVALLSPVVGVIYLVSGIPGSGKTTVSRALAARLGPQAVAIEGDVLSFDFVVRGAADPSDAATWKRQMQLRRRNIILLATSFGDDGFDVVIDDVVVNRAALATYDALSRPAQLVVLAPTLDVVRRRDAERHKQVFEMWSHLDSELRTELAGIGRWIDSSALSVEETVNAILAT